MRRTCPADRRDRCDLLHARRGDRRLRIARRHAGAGSAGRCARPDGSFLAPATPAFSIWSVIYVLLIAYAVWQALPSQRSRAPTARRRMVDRRDRGAQRHVARPRAVRDPPRSRSPGSSLLLIALCVTFVQTVRFPAEGVLDSVLIDGTTGLHLGWVSLATVANAAAWLTAIGRRRRGRPAQTSGESSCSSSSGVIGVAIPLGERLARDPRSRHRVGAVLARRRPPAGRAAELADRG